MKLSTLIAAVLLMCPGLVPVHAQTYPAKPVRLVVGFPPGGATDVVARTISQKLGEALGQSVIVDNRAGAASNIGAELVAHSPKDGYTLFMGTVSTSINPTLYRKLAYDPLRDFVPVSQVTGTPFVPKSCNAKLSRIFSTRSVRSSKASFLKEWWKNSHRCSQTTTVFPRSSAKFVRASSPELRWRHQCGGPPSARIVHVRSL